MQEQANKKLDLSKKLYTAGGLAKLITATDDGKLIFQDAKGTVVVTDHYGMRVGGKGSSKHPAVWSDRITGSYKTGDTVWTFMRQKNGTTLLRRGVIKDMRGAGRSTQAYILYDETKYRNPLHQEGCYIHQIGSLYGNLDEIERRLFGEMEQIEKAKKEFGT